MVLAALFGFPLGASAGLLIGNFFARKISARRTYHYLEQCDQAADDNVSIPYPKTSGSPVSYFKKKLLKDTSPSLTEPDYERALFINKVLSLLWPHLSPAIHKEVMQQAKVPIDEAVANIPLVETIRIDKLDLGSRPFRIDSFKSYNTADDEIVIEAPLFWGGDMSIRVTAVIVVGGMKVDVPIDVSDLQFKFLARVTIKPLVEALPCVGGVTISLLEEPKANFTLRVAESPDILALPGVPFALRMAINIVTSAMLVYPNEYIVPLLPNFGLPPPPLGILRVRVISGHDIKSSFFDVVDPFVMLEVREGRGRYTSVVNDNPDPEWDEVIDLVVDDPAKQPLKIVVLDDDLIKPDVVGGIIVDLSSTSLMSDPRKPIKLRLPIYAPGPKGDVPEADENELADAIASATMDEAIETAISSVPKRHTIIGRMRRKRKIKALTEQIKAEGGPSPHSGAAETAAARLRERKAASVASTDEAHSNGEGSDGTEKKRPSPGSIVGSVTLEATFIPVHSSSEEMEAGPSEGGAEEETVKTMEDRAPSLRRSLVAATLHGSLASTRGILTVHLKKVIGLPDAMATYVALRLHDPQKMPESDTELKTQVELNEHSPRFNFKTDFVGISGSSVLTLTVYSQPGIMESLASLKIPFIKKGEATPLGKVRIPLLNVITAGQMKDTLPLQDAEAGEMQLALHWTTVDFEERGRWA